MSTKNTNKIREALKKLKEDELIDQAADQFATPSAPEVGTAEPTTPVGTQPAAAPQAAPSANNPLVPPQPGMIPIGWMWPQQSAVATAMQTGDVNMAGQAPDAMPLEPAGEEGEGADDMLTDEEKQLLESEYVAWKAKRAKMAEKSKKSKIKEAEMGDELAPAMPEEVELVEPPVEGDLDDMGDEDLDVDADLDVEDIVVDIAEIFRDAGDDLEALVSDDDAGEEDIPMDDDFVDEEVVDEIPEDDAAGDDTLDMDDLEAEKAALEEKIKAYRARRKEAAAKPINKQIKYPAGSTPSDVDRVAERIAQRREAIKALRSKRAALREEGIADDADPDKLDKEEGYESVNSVIDKLGESSIKRSTNRSLDKKFVERYNEKKSLNFKELLEKGLLG